MISWNVLNYTIILEYWFFLTSGMRLPPLNSLFSRILQMLSFNFGESIKRWVSTFCTGPESEVSNNGFQVLQII